MLVLELCQVVSGPVKPPESCRFMVFPVLFPKPFLCQVPLHPVKFPTCVIADPALMCCTYVSLAPHCVYKHLTFLVLFARESLSCWFSQFLVFQPLSLSI